MLTQKDILFIVKDSGAFLERRFSGLTRVEIQCSKNEFYNFTNYAWGYQVNLQRLQSLYIIFKLFFFLVNMIKCCFFINKKINLLLHLMKSLQVGLFGEKLQIYREENIHMVEWSKANTSLNQPLTWYKVCDRNL